MLRRILIYGLMGCLIGSVTGLLIAAVVSYIMPRAYESEALIQITPDSISEKGKEGVTDRSVLTACEVLTSKKVLEQTVENLSLVEHWNIDKESCIDRLQAMCTAEAIRGTDLISIRVRHVDRVDARDIAREIAESYSIRTKELLASESEHYLRELNRAVREQQDKVEERRKVLSIIVKSKKIGEDGNPAGEDEIERVLDAQDYLDAKREFEMEMELLQSLKLKQLAETISRKVPTSAVQIHSEPQIGQIPLSPNVPLILFSGIAGGALFGSLSAIPIAIIRKPKPPKISQAEAASQKPSENS